MEQFISTQEFVQAFRETFGEKAELPLVFGFGDEAANPHTPKIGGCLFKALDMARKGRLVSLSAETVSCGVELPKPFINFCRVDRAQSFEGMEGLLFFATPDVLSGLAAWAFFDSNDPQTVTTPFVSGCGDMLQMAVRENRDNGSRTFLGLFDPSDRHYVAADELGFVIPRSRFLSMQHTLRRCCLFDTNAWQKVRKRISHPDNIIYTQKYYSPCGNLILGSFGDRLCLCDWEKSPHRSITDKRLRKSLHAEFEEGTSNVLREAAGQLDSYFAGKQPRLSVPMLFAGSAFQKTVWQALADIPYGETLSYGELARRIGHPTAVRAVANAVGANPISLFAPCHRVIGSDRSLTGYAGGLPAKQFLLQLESDVDLLF